MNRMFSATLSVLIVMGLIFIAHEASAGVLTIQSGSSLNINGATLDLNCGSLTVNGYLNLGSGTVINSGKPVVGDGGNISGSGAINYCSSSMSVFLTGSQVVSGYKSISMPFQVVDTSAVGLLGPQIGTYIISQFRIGRWNSNAGGYDEYPNLGALSPGHAFWFLSRNNFSLVFSGVHPSTTTAPITGTQSHRVRLLSGWNQVGNPFFYPINMTGAVVQESSGGTENFFSGSITQGLFWVYSGGAYVPTTIISPVQGGWIKKVTSGDGWIYFPAIPSSTADPMTDQPAYLPDEVERPPAPPGADAGSGWSSSGGGGGGGGGCFILTIWE